MATMVDRPISVRLDSPVEHIVPQRRNRVEIIDVDSLDSDEESGPSAGPSHTSRRVRARRARSPSVEVIEVVSDGENESTRARLRIFSPPPQFAPTVIPPVPPIPRHLASHTSLPMRRHPPPHPVHPPVRAHDRPFDFEGAFSNHNSGSSSRPRTASGAATLRNNSTRAAPRLGLGGALIQSNNAQLRAEREERHRRLLATRRSREHALNAAVRIRNFGRLEDGIDNILTNFYLGLLDMEPSLQRTITRPELEYKQEYTHPGRPEPGFTFNFGASEGEGDDESGGQSKEFPPTSQENPIVINDDGDDIQAAAQPSQDKGKGKAVPVSESESTFKLKTQLVCSHCRDLLLLGESASKLGPEQEKMRRIWSLRCGHLIDGKCLDALSTPKDEESGNSKGKGKATAPTEPLPEPNEGSSIRSRLRSYHSLLVAPMMFTKPQKKPVTEEYRWQCPVTNCGREHVSVKVGEEGWVPGKQSDGAIPVFV